MSDPPDQPLLPPLPGDDEPTVEAAREPVVEQAPVETREGRRRRTIDGRRLWPAGHALLVAVLALSLGLLLNAPGIHKTAYNQPDGWKRDVATEVTGPLADVSRALLLDRPRALVKATIGRTGDDEIDLSIEAAPVPVVPRAKPTKPVAAPKPKPTPSPAPARKLAFTPHKQLRLWVAGDSLVITPGYAIFQAAGASPVITGVGGIEGRVATGLTRPDVFNWFDEFRAKMKELKPNAVVLGFGGNDDKAYMTGLPEGVSIGEFGDAAWRREYRRRLAIVFGTITRGGGHVVWIGLPITRSALQTRRFDIVNATVVAEARRWPKRVTYVDTYTIFAGVNGGFAEYLPNAQGRTERVRASDGVHFEAAGGKIIAREVLKALNKAYDLTSWRATD